MSSNLVEGKCNLPAANVFAQVNEHHYSEVFSEIDVGLRRPMFTPFGNEDWHRQLLHYARIAKTDTDRPDLFQQLDILEQLLLMRDECDRQLVMIFEVPNIIDLGELGRELECERVTHRFPDSTTVELTVCDRGSKSHLEQLARYAFERCVGICKARVSYKLG